MYNHYRPYINKFLIGLISIGIIVNIVNCFNFVNDPIHRNKASYDKDKMGIDSQTFVEEARSIVKSGYFFKAMNMQHSPGYQLLVSYIYRVFGEMNNFAVKMFNIFFWIVTIGLIYLILNALSENLLIALVGSFIFSCIEVTQKYNGLLCYEVLAMLLVTLSVYLSIIKKRVLLPLLLSVLIIIRVNFVILSCLYFIYELFFYRDKKSTLFLLVHFIIISIWIYNNEGNFLPRFLGERFHLVTTSVATGESYPHTELTSQSGFSFIFGNPVGYLKLCWNRLLYLFGFYKDIWYIDGKLFSIFRGIGLSDSLSTKIPSVLIMVTTFFGMGVTWKKENNLPVLIAILNIVLLIFAWGMSTRHLISAIPSILIIQILGMYQLPHMIKKLKRR